MSDGVNGLGDLERKFRGYTFRHFEHATCKVLRWQAGRIEVERVTVMEEHNINGGSTPVELEVEKFHMLACAATSAELMEHLGQLPPPYRELLDA